ncbi:MAG TPA: hypothetical protein VN397_01635 [Candidatus Methylomirabilis sp.]|nr:hypothetical protein [Candidatus Methylomirabilis sp.]
MSGVEQASRLRPGDDVLFGRFIAHARRSVRVLNEPTILVFPWRVSVDYGLRQTLALLSEKLSVVETGYASRNVLILQDHESAFDFESYARRDGVILGKLHQGGIWLTDWGRFLLITWHPTLPRAEIGKRLAGFLATDGASQTEDEEQFTVPSSPLPSRSQRHQTRRPSSTAFRAVSPGTLPDPSRRTSERPSKRRP